MDVRAIAMYLPQFHPIPENDTWWGKGFTEWTNVTRARALYRGHYQPRLPTDLGFYDLRLPEAQVAQAELARAYGLFGFCYYYYWFNGKKLLNTPIEAMLSSGKPDFPFCICWANENWTRTWDGWEDHILMEQGTAPEDQIPFLADIVPFLKDPRYITIGGRPLVLVYRPELLGDPLFVTDSWRRVAEQCRIAEPYLVKCEHGFVQDLPSPEQQGFDAAYEFPPLRSPWIPPSSDFDAEIGHGMQLYDYRSVITGLINREWPPYKLFRGVMLHWDNTARRGKKGASFVNFSPDAYEYWLTEISLQTIECHRPEERFVFINAWNEWAEGTYLEPCQRYGRLNLQATKRALSSAGAYAKLGKMQSEYVGVSGMASELGVFFRNQRNILDAVSRIALGHETASHSKEQLFPREEASECESQCESQAIQQSSCMRVRRLLLSSIRKMPGGDLLLAGMRRARDTGMGFGRVVKGLGSRPDSNSSGRAISSSNFGYRGKLSGGRGSRTVDGTDEDTVLFISHDASLTGAPIILLSLLEQLKSTGDFHLRVVLRRGGPLVSRFEEIGQTLTLTGEENDDIKNLRRFVGSCNVRLIYSNTAVCGDILQWLAYLKAPVISHIHELEVAIQRFAGNGLFEMVKAYTDHFIVVSQAVRQNLIINHRIPANDISVVYGWTNDHGLVGEELSRHRKRVRNELNIPDSAFVVGGCGTLDWRKGPDLFIQMAREMGTSFDANDVYFTWVGGDVNSIECKQLKHEARTCGLDSRVRFIGHTHTPLSYFSIFDVFALTSREDPFPLVCLEALSLGIPVTCFADAGGMQELVDKDCGAVVPYLNVREMGRAILELKANPEERARKGARGAEIINERHSVEKKEPEIRALITRLLGGEDSPITVRATSK